MLLVASSRSFGAVNREQFYVSISRGRERVHVFTDDADLLARRVSDSHERKAAVELQALRDDLAKLGFIRKLQQLQANTTPVDSRAVRPMRQSERVSRPTRLSPVQRLAQTMADVRRWLTERFGVEQKGAVTEMIQQTESIKPAVSVKPTKTIKRSRTVKEVLQQEQPLRRKFGRGITPPRDTGHTHGIHI